MPELHVRAVSARNLRDAQVFGRQDPFCKITVGHRTFQTKVHDNGGRNPVWNDKFVFDVSDAQLQQLTIEIWDKNFVSNDYIGSCRLPVSIFNHGKIVDQWYPVNFRNQQRGEINLRVQLLGILPGHVPTATAATQVAYAQPVYPNHGYPTSGYAQQHAQLQQQQLQQQMQIQQQQAQLQAQQAQLAHQQAQMVAAASAPQYAPTPVYGAPVYVAPPPQVVYAPSTPVVMAPPTVVYGAPSYGYHHHHYRRGYGDGDDGGYGVAAGAGLGLAGGLLLGAVLSDDGLFD
jgi:hypothetical protein